MRVSVVIPSWNRSDLLRGVLHNLSQQTSLPGQVIVVDNGSTDDSRKVATAGGAEVIALERNVGFAEAVNRGIQSAQGEWVLILNNDVVLNTDWLEILLMSAGAQNAEFAAGKLLDYRDTGMIDGTWDLVSRAAYAWRCGYGRPDSGVWSTARWILMAPMTAVLFQRTVFERVGLLETRFESYYEDVDFGIRCAMAGVKGIYEPAAVARHMGKATLGRSSYRVMYLTARNQVFLLAKHYPGRTLRRFGWAILVGQMLAVVAAAKHGHLIAALAGKWEGLRRWGSIRRVGDQSLPVEALLYESEQTIRNLQSQIGHDLYWRLYFALTRGTL